MQDLPLQGLCSILAEVSGLLTTVDPLLFMVDDQGAVIATSDLLLNLLRNPGKRTATLLTGVAITVQGFTPPPLRCLISLARSVHMRRCEHVLPHPRRRVPQRNNPLVRTVPCRQRRHGRRLAAPARRQSRPDRVVPVTRTSLFLRGRCPGMAYVLIQVPCMCTKLYTISAQIPAHDNCRRAIDQPHRDGAVDCVCGHRRLQVPVPAESYLLGTPAPTRG